MIPQDFCYWLQGWFEISTANKIDLFEINIIKSHLNLVFAHSIDTPDLDGKLQNMHDGTPLSNTNNKPPVRC